jgi:DNA-binding MarR family transcriptional regulator
MNVPITGEIGDLLGDVRIGLVDELQQRITAAGYGDVRAAHDCVFRYLDSEGTRLRDLATRSQMTPQSVGEHVDELELLGYVERVPDPSDRRAKLIRPTERGLAFMAAGLDALAEIEREWRAAIGMETLVRLRGDLGAIRSLQREIGSDKRSPQ